MVIKSREALEWRLRNAGGKNHLVWALFDWYEHHLITSNSEGHGCPALPVYAAPSLKAFALEEPCRPR